MENRIQNQVNETIDGIYAPLGITDNEDQREKLMSVVEDAVIKVTLETINREWRSRYQMSDKINTVEGDATSSHSALIAILSSMR